MARRLVLAVGVTLTGCVPQLGAYEPGGAGTGGEGGVFVPTSCGANGICVEIPPGWQGRPSR